MKEDLKIVAQGILGALCVWAWIFVVFSLSSIH